METDTNAGGIRLLGIPLLSSVGFPSLGVQEGSNGNSHGNGEGQARIQEVPVSPVLECKSPWFQV